MTTLSGNAGPYMKPLGYVMPPPFPGSGLIDVSKLKKRAKRNRYETGVRGLVKMESLVETVTKEVSPGVWEFKGKKGVWRTIRGRRYFFPKNGDPIPPLPEKGYGGGWAERAKKEMLPKIESMLIKARRAKRKHVEKALKAMQGAVKSGDEDAFRKAEEKLAKATKKEKKRTGQ